MRGAIAVPGAARPNWSYVASVSFASRSSSARATSSVTRSNDDDDVECERMACSSFASTFDWAMTADAADTQVAFARRCAPGDDLTMSSITSPRMSATTATMTTVSTIRRRSRRVWFGVRRARAPSTAETLLGRHRGISKPRRHNRGARLTRRSHPR